VSKEAIIEFVCAGECDEDERPTYMVDGYFNVNGEFVPDSLDEMGSDMDCPECGERGEPTDPDVRVADV
jgi:hypothetical protein